MITTYPAHFMLDERGHYQVSFLDIPLQTSGSTYAQAMNKAMSSLADFIYKEQKAGHSLPEPSLDIRQENINQVSVNVEEYARAHYTHAVRKSLSIPAWLDDKVKAKKINLSQFLQESLKQAFGII